MIVAKLRKSKGAATALDVLEPLFVLIPLLLGTAFLVDGRSTRSSTSAFKEGIA